MNKPEVPKSVFKIMNEPHTDTHKKDEPKPEVKYPMPIFSKGEIEDFPDEKKILIKSDYILVKKCEDFGSIKQRDDEEDASKEKPPEKDPRIQPAPPQDCVVEIDQGEEESCFGQIENQNDSLIIELQE
jgi:hypothetical protein